MSVVSTEMEFPACHGNSGVPTIKTRSVMKLTLADSDDDLLDEEGGG